MNSLSKASSNYELPVKRRLVMNSLSKASSNYEQFESSVVKLESSELSQQIYKHLWIFPSSLDFYLFIWMSVPGQSSSVGSQFLAVGLDSQLWILSSVHVSSINSK